jgi:hypothetical protein
MQATLAVGLLCCLVQSAMAIPVSKKLLPVVFVRVFVSYRGSMRIISVHELL